MGSDSMTDNEFTCKDLVEEIEKEVKIEFQYINQRETELVLQFDPKDKKKIEKIIKRHDIKCELGNRSVVIPIKER